MEKESSFRDKIGKYISVSVIIATGVLGVLGIILGVFYIIESKGSKDGLGEAKSILQFIFSALLPLWGTWIGSVLAYYFSKENFEAASKSTADLIKQITPDDKLKSTPVTMAMMSIDVIKYLKNTEGETKTVVELIKFLTDNNIRRAILLDVNKVFRFILHRSTLDFFLSKNALVGKQKADLDKLSIDELIKDGDPMLQKVVMNGAAFVSLNDNLLKARDIMEALDGCNDVFVTETGRSGEPVIGWITNVDIIKYGKY